MSDDNRPGQQPGQQPDLGGPGPYGARQDAPTEWMQTNRPPPADPGQGSGGAYPGAPSGSGGSGGGRRRWIVPVAAVAAVALVGGGAFAAYSVLSGGGPQPSEAIPVAAIAYARIDLDPSADQKINMLQLLRRVPEFEHETGITSDTDDLRKRAFEAALEDSDACADIDYDDDIAPWIGERAAVAAMPSDEKGADPEPLIALQVSDEDQARDGIQALIDCGAGAEGDDSDDVNGLAFVGEYAVLATSQDQAESFAAAAEDESLADSDAFSADMGALDGEGLASFWVDLDAVVAIAEESDPELASSLKAFGYDDLGSVALALRAQSDAIELVSVTSGDLSLLGPGADGGSEPVTDVQLLPDSTLAALGFTGGGDAITRLWDRLDQLADDELSDELGPGGLQGLADQIAAQSGIVLPDDLAVLLGDQFTLALDSEGLDVEQSTGAPDPSSINLGARMRTDPDAVRDLVGRVQDLVAAQLGLRFEIADADLDEGIVLASNDDYAQQLAKDGALGDSEVFQSAVADADSATSVFFLDFDMVSEVADRIGAQSGDPLPDDVSGALDALRAFGVSTTDDGDYNRTTMRLVFD